MGRTEISVQEIMTWVLLRRAMQATAYKARGEVFDRIEGRPDAQDRWPDRRTDRDRNLRSKKLSAEKIKTIRAILAEAIDPTPVP